MNVRAATASDCPAIARIVNDEIRERLSIFRSTERSDADLIEELAFKQGRALPMFVGEGANGKVLGYATYSPFRPGEGYELTMEHTVMLDPQAQGQGIGRALMSALEDHARTHGVHSLIAAISATNATGVKFHAALGFHTVGTMPEAGFKAGQWLGLVLMQKLL